MRLIDADALNLDYEVDMADDWKTAHEIANVVKYAPTIDAVEVVRCRDCKYQDKGENESEAWNTCGLRPWVHVPTSDDHFCASGERKDGDSDE